ncbi:alpha/beta fold hydrolase [Coralloluteibacterium stylophorae]|uniref:Alpha/beta hydrolase n=1 Tax=Coralloluteibacterium stylophorae TaxID=1776034 RepID=A0A8J8AX03_9GAMM|nr:alpha/beta hydrolase [Coralloluteibacterium stylophorae]MBS7455778.1 alpha/beta hydrolase [Coralloluteibacterium stylophorae]
MLRTTTLALLLAVSPLPSIAHARSHPVDPDAPTVVLVHGAFADASSWDQIVPRLQAWGVPTVAVHNPLTALADDVQATREAIAAAPGKVVLVGHSWGGTVITQAGDDPKVSALVYVAAFAPDVGQTSAQQGAGFPTAPGLLALQDHDGFLSLSPATVAEDFAQDQTPAVARDLYEMQVPLAASALDEPVTAAAWRTHPSWYVISRHDRMLAPQLQAATARRIGARVTSLPSSHVSPLSAPREVAEAILEAAGLDAPAASPADLGG